MTADISLQDRSTVPGPFWQRLHEGQRGLCSVRGRVDDHVVLTPYGRSNGSFVDPIEKKPLNHFPPRSGVPSFGTAGCNPSCRFCQNRDIPGRYDGPGRPGRRAAAAAGFPGRELIGARAHIRGRRPVLPPLIRRSCRPCPAGAPADLAR